MSYYLLPKTNNNIEFNFLLDNNAVDIYTSHSLFFNIVKYTHKFLRYLMLTLQIWLKIYQN